MKSFLCLVVLVLSWASHSGFAATFETVRDGNWSDPAVWMGGVYPSNVGPTTLLPTPPNWFTASTGDRIIVKHQVTLDYSVLVTGTDVLLIEADGVILANAPFGLLNLSPGQANFPVGGPQAGIIVRGAIETEYLRNTGFMTIEAGGRVNVFGNFDQFAQTLNEGSFHLTSGTFFNRLGTMENKGSLVINQGDFINEAQYLTGIGSCTSIYGNFQNDSLATVGGQGFVWVQDSIDNQTNALTVWDSAQWCAGLALNVPAPLQNCANANCNGIIPTQCNAAFSVGAIGQAYVFNNYASGFIGGYLWDFGDGTTSTLVTPFHQYTSPGTYTVCLTVQDSALGFCDSTCRVVQFSSGPCFANFQYLQTGNTVTFANASSGNINTFSWDFGDGGTANVANPSHIYSQPGTYQVCLTLQAPGGGTCDSLCRTIEVVPDTCNASFSHVIRLDSVDYTFTGSGTYTNIEWDFGDGQMANTLNPTHGYTLPGTYTVCMKLFETFGTVCDSVCETIVVPVGACTADFSFTQTDSLLHFTDLSTGDHTRMVWHFGDGDTDSIANPSHVYDSTGFYLVCLELWDAFGLLCDSSCTVVNIGVVSRASELSSAPLVTVYPNPFSDVLHIEMNTRQPTQMSLTNLSGALIQQWELPATTAPQRLIWEGTTLNGHPVPNGLYFLQVQAPDHPSTRIKIALIR